MPLSSLIDIVPFFLPFVPGFIIIPPDVSQTGFRGRNDDGSETTATWIAATNTNWTQDTDVNFRVRFLISCDAASITSAYQLQYNRNGAGWNNVNGSSSVVRSSGSANLTDGADTTQQIGSGTFTADNNGVDDVDGATGSSTFTAGDEIETEHCIQIRSADVSDGDTIQLRLVFATGSAAFQQYFQTPSITVNVPTPSTNRVFIIN